MYIFMRVYMYVLCMYNVCYMHIYYLVGVAAPLAGVDTVHDRSARRGEVSVVRIGNIRLVNMLIYMCVQHNTHITNRHRP
jgi:hypothetical protein